ncbi:MAG: hypothetical protein QF926_11680 [Alphaproteobacteria bacterium]|jgi:hypothetical protein|nr:hypothetical protein [Alphaproteobacteria bacterium]MDP6517266.1 hypothetical protein [Alphaproteobacteria bacterium]|tara:strand:+ start:372 stop:662 length:291 start_codon:yes stop_codon:yes gene_type:complete
MVDGIRALVEGASKIVFLGFAYRQQNLSLFRIENRTPAKKVFGTAFGISDSDKSIIEGQISNLFGPPQNRSVKISLNNTIRCVDFFDEYRRAISFV